MQNCSYVKEQSKESQKMSLWSFTEALLSIMSGLIYQLLLFLN